MRCVTILMASASLLGFVRAEEHRGRAVIRVGRDYGRMSQIGELAVRGPAYTVQWGRLTDGELVPSREPVDDGTWLAVVYGDTAYHRFLPPRPLVGWPRQVDVYYGHRPEPIASARVPKGRLPMEALAAAYPGRRWEWDDPQLRVATPCRYPLPRCLAEGWTAFGDAGRLGGAGHGIFILRPGDLLGGDRVVRLETGGWSTSRVWIACTRSGPVLVHHDDLLDGRAEIPAECVGL